MTLFSFVILHYNTIDDTVECIESIKKYVGFPNYHIIVVDNASKNKTGKLLEKKYRADNKITLLLNNENLGFARGNNIGFNYAKYTLKADFIALINNDTFITQNSFISKVIDCFEKYGFHILGPDIISTVDNSHQNPRDESLDSIEHVQQMVQHFRNILLLNYLFLDDVFIRVKKFFISTSKLPKSKTSFSVMHDTELLNVKLHGSALIFSKKYIEKYDGLFPKTFMYSEESILYFIAKRDGLTTLYSPEVVIYHKEDSATDSVYKNKLFKRRFYLKNFIKSGNELIKIMKNEERWPN